MTEVDILERELRLIRGLLAASLALQLQGIEGTQRDAVAVLHNAGLEPREIATLLGTTANNVSVALVALRKAGRVKARAKAVGEE